MQRTILIFGPSVAISLVKPVYYLKISASVAYALNATLIVFIHIGERVLPEGLRL
jgi:hypothetical protein